MKKSALTSQNMGCFLVARVERIASFTKLQYDKEFNGFIDGQFAVSVCYNITFIKLSIEDWMF